MGILMSGFLHGILLQSLNGAGTEECVINHDRFGLQGHKC